MGKGWGDNGVCEMCPLVGDGTNMKIENSFISNVNS
jgi:hypothetical protein